VSHLVSQFLICHPGFDSIGSVGMPQAIPGQVFGQTDLIGVPPKMPGKRMPVPRYPARVNKNKHLAGLATAVQVPQESDQGGIQADNTRAGNHLLVNGFVLFFVNHPAFEVDLIENYFPHFARTGARAPKEKERPPQGPRPLPHEQHIFGMLGRPAGSGGKPHSFRLLVRGMGNQFLIFSPYKSADNGIDNPFFGVAALPSWMIVEPCGQIVSAALVHSFGTMSGREFQEIPRGILVGMFAEIPGNTAFLKMGQVQVDNLLHRDTGAIAGWRGVRKDGHGLSLLRIFPRTEALAWRLARYQSARYSNSPHLAAGGGLKQVFNYTFLLMDCKEKIAVTGRHRDPGVALLRGSAPGFIGFSSRHRLVAVCYFCSGAGSLFH
jgi:hypothetical protein